MSTPNDAPIQGMEMSDAEIDDFLRSQGVGVLSLADDGDAYGVPLSFGYDDENLYSRSYTERRAGEWKSASGPGGRV